MAVPAPVPLPVPEAVILSVVLPVPVPVPVVVVMAAGWSRTDALAVTMPDQMVSVEMLSLATDVVVVVSDSLHSRCSSQILLARIQRSPHR